MPADDVVLLAARNAFLLVLVTLVAVSTYQFVEIGGISPAIGLVWVVAAGGFYVSKWCYGRRGANESAAD